MSNPVWVHVLALIAWTLNKSHKMSGQEAVAQITNNYMQVKFILHPHFTKSLKHDNVYKLYL